MKRIAILLFVLLVPVLTYAGNAVINKEKCTITKDGKTFPLSGEVYITESRASADMEVYITNSPSFADMEVYITNSPDATNRCGKVYITNSSSFADIKVYITNSPSFADIEVYITNNSGTAGII